MGREHEAVCLQAGILTSTKMKEEGRLSDMQGIPIQLAFSKDTSLSGHVWARFDSSRCSHADQKHESGSVRHKFNPFQQMDINQIALVGSNDTISGSNTRLSAIITSAVKRM